MVYPEGTRRRKLSIDGDNLLPFKKGPFHLAKKLNFRIIPIVLSGSLRLLPKGHYLPKGGTLFMKYLEPIEKEEI